MITPLLCTTLCALSQVPPSPPTRTFVLLGIADDAEVLRKDRVALRKAVSKNQGDLALPPSLADKYVVAKGEKITVFVSKHFPGFDQLQVRDAAAAALKSWTPGQTIKASDLSPSGKDQLHRMLKDIRPGANPADSNFSVVVEPSISIRTTVGNRSLTFDYRDRSDSRFTTPEIMDAGRVAESPDFDPQQYLAQHQDDLPARSPMAVAIAGTFGQEEIVLAFQMARDLYRREQARSKSEFSNAAKEYFKTDRYKFLVDAPQGDSLTPGIQKYLKLMWSEQYVKNTFGNEAKADQWLNQCGYSIGYQVSFGVRIGKDAGMVFFTVR